MKRQNELMVSNIFLLFTFFTVTLEFGSAGLIPPSDRSLASITTNDEDVENAPMMVLEHEDAPYDNDESLEFRIRLRMHSGPILNAKQGENVLLSCQVLGRAPLSINWYKRSASGSELLVSHKINTFPKPVDRRGFGAIVSKHLIKCVQPKDMGSYFCAAISDTKRKEANETRLTVTGNNTEKCEPLTTPVVTLKYAVTFNLKGSAVILPCRSLPPYQTQWWDNEGRIINNSTDKEILPEGDLSIKNLKLSDGGSYKCKVQSQSAPTTEFETAVHPYVVFKM